jgi:hypothetical protein
MYRSIWVGVPEQTMQLGLRERGGYDFFNEDLVKYGEKWDVPSVVTPSMASLKSCLLFDPGELGWASLPNLYFWIDRKNGLGGFWATQIFPFADPVSFGGYMDFETAVYEDAPSTV